MVVDKRHESLLCDSVIAGNNQVTMLAIVLPHAVQRWTVHPPATEAQTSLYPEPSTCSNSACGAVIETYLPPSSGLRVALESSAGPMKGEKFLVAGSTKVDEVFITS